MRIGERMERSAVAQQLPIHASGIHFLFKSRQLLFRNQWIGSAVQDQHLTLDVFRIVDVRCIQRAVERDCSFYRRTGPGQLQRTATPKAETERGQLRGIDGHFALALQLLERHFHALTQ